MDIDILEEVFAINVAGPAAITQAFLPLVEKSAKKTIVNISSTLGSIGADMGPVHTSYSISKTAMNMLVRFYMLIMVLASYPDTLVS